MTGISSPVVENINNANCDCDFGVDYQIKELNYNFRDALTDRPEILKYIERLHTIIRRQQKKLNKFQKKLRDIRLANKLDTQDKESQTTVRLNSNEDAWNAFPCISHNSIADEVKEVAENALKHTSFAYEPTSGMYYDYGTGYYYNAELRMYYDGNTGQYLEYDEATKSYKYYSGNINAENKISNHLKAHSNQKKLRKTWEKYKCKRTKRNNQHLDEAEEGEITESSISVSETSCSDGETEINLNDKESLTGCEPCMRIMVEETNVEKLKVGSLFVITCKGGTLGREGDHAVLIPDINVSKHHAKFIFNPQTSLYYITDLGSRNGTWLDGERLSAALQESETFEINHGATLQIGSTKLLCHIHIGRDTCFSCEPGLFKQASNASVWDSGPKNSEYREQLQHLKKKFGVDGFSQDVFNVPGYEDRAELRRSAVGSSHSSEKTQTASLSECIPKCNKGFQMLSKMGWIEGQTLGKSDGGLIEPMPFHCSSGKQGLGMASTEIPNNVSKFIKRRHEILKKTQNRYRNIGSSPKDDSE